MKHGKQLNASSETRGSVNEGFVDAISLEVSALTSSEHCQYLALETYSNS